MKIRDIFAKLDEFGLFMQEWGVLQEKDEGKEANMWHQAAATTRDELISDIKEIGDRASKSDKAYNVYLMHQAGALTATEAIAKIGLIYR
jgi:molybdopterin synthase catalytic subunit